MIINTRQESYDAGVAERWNGHLGTVPTPKGKAQRLGTQDCNIFYVSDYFGFLIHTLGMPPGDASLCQLGGVRAVEAFIQYKKDSKPDELLEDRALSKHDAKCLLTFDQILDYVSRDISFRNKLKPIPGYLTEDDVKFIQNHWKEHFQAASEALQINFQNEIAQCKSRADNEAMIESILISKNPMKLLHDLRRAAQRRVDRAKTKFQEAVALRDLFIIAVMLVICLFRPKTVCHLDYLPGDLNNSCFQFADRDGNNGWWICAKKEFFKNFDKPILQDGFLRMIGDIDGLHDYIKAYLFEARGVLLDGSQSACLVVNTSTSPRFSPDAYGDHVRYLTNRLLTVDLAGRYPGVTSLSTTQVRKLFGTALHYKHKDPAYTEVKNALMNECPTIYSRIRKRDRSLGAENFVAETALDKSFAASVTPKPR